jgi:adenylate cyclase
LLAKASEGTAQAASLVSGGGASVLAFAWPSVSRNAYMGVVTSGETRFQQALVAKKKTMRVNYLIAQNGAYLVHPDQSEVARGADARKEELYSALSQSKARSGQLKHRGLDGVIYRSSYARLADLSAWVVCSVPEDRALEAVFKVQRESLYVALMVLAVAILILWFYAKTLTVPLKELVGAVGRIEEGEYIVDLNGKKRDEIGLLNSSVMKMGHGLADRERLKDTFGRFVNKEIAERAMAGTLKLGGERKTATVFFSDIRNFTKLSDSLEPEEVVEFLNDYMTRMVKCVNDSGGVVDKFIGDYVMAVWGAPVEVERSAIVAVNAALAMREALIEFNRTRGDERHPVIRIGCGLNTGPVIAGQIGSNDRMEYTVIGDTVNVASRIESLNKAFATDILVSASTKEELGSEFLLEPMRPILIKGKEGPQQVYAVLGRAGTLSCPRSLAELQARLGVEPIDLDAVDVEAEEQKFRVIEQ